MSGVMIKVAIYGLVRVLVDWLGVLPLWLGVLVLAVGALSAVGGVVYALFQHDLKRLLAFHSIENVGIIVLGLGACLLLRARGAETWAALALAAALLHTLNHAVFKALLFLGAGAFERAVGSLELDRLGGLLRRMPWTGGAFLVGALAIAGLPPLNGFASEWLTLQALAARARLRRASATGSPARSRSPRSRRPPRWRSSASSRSSGSCCSGRRGARRSREAVEAPVADARRGGGARRLPASCSASRPGLLVGSLAGLAPWPASTPDVASGCVCRAPDRCRRSGSRSCSAALAPALVRCCAGRRVAAPAPTLGVRPARRAAARLDERRLHEAAAARARGGAAPAAGDRGTRGGRRRAGGLLQRPRAAPDRRAALPPAVRVGARRGGARAASAERPPRHLRRAT